MLMGAFRVSLPRILVLDRLERCLARRLAMASLLDLGVPLACAGRYVRICLQLQGVKNIRRLAARA